MVKHKSSKHTNHAFKNATKGQRLQNIVMQPGSCKMSEVAIHHLHGCPITRTDIQVADNIFGPNLGSLKGKMVIWPNPHIRTGIDNVPHDIMKIHKSITLSIDIMFVNKLPFFITLSRSLKFGTVEALSDQKVGTIVTRLKDVTKIYQHRGFKINTIIADQEFEPIRPWFLMLNT